MSKVIAVAGKGGTGKTTVAALAVRHLVQAALTPVLAVDADPNSNLGESLGIDIGERTIGDMREDFFQAKGAVPAGMSKDVYFTMMLNRIMIEETGYDLLVMGRQEGPGCYCFINNILRHYSEELANNYKYLVVDNEAGMEHLSRRTTHAVDSLWLVTDHALRGLRAVRRINDLIDSLNLTIKNRGIVVNRAPAELDPAFLKEVEDIGLPIWASVPSDPALMDFDMSQRSLFEMDDDSPSVKAVSDLVVEHATF